MDCWQQGVKLILSSMEAVGWVHSSVGLMLPPSPKSWSRPPVTQSVVLFLIFKKSNTSDEINIGADYNIKTQLWSITSRSTGNVSGSSTIISNFFYQSFKSEPAKINKNGAWKGPEILIVVQSTAILIKVTEWIWKKSEEQGLASLEWSPSVVSFVNMFTKDQHQSCMIFWKQILILFHYSVLL